MHRYLLTGFREVLDKRSKTNISLHRIEDSFLRQHLAQTKELEVRSLTL